jgi:hypothetical protein
MTRKIRAFSLLATLALGGCASMSSIESLTSNPLIASMTSSLGFSPTQAIGGAGAMLGMAQQNMDQDTWGQLSKLLPNTDDLIGQAKALGGIGDTFGGMSDMTGAFDKMGLSSDQVKMLSPALTDYVSKAGSPDLGQAFKSAIK